MESISKEHFSFFFNAACDAHADKNMPGIFVGGAFQIPTWSAVQAQSCLNHISDMLRQNEIRTTNQIDVALKIVKIALDWSEKRQELEAAQHARMLQHKLAEATL